MVWLLSSYSRALSEDKHTAKRFGVGGGAERKAVLALCKESCVSHSTLVLSEMEHFDPTFVLSTET